MNLISGDNSGVMNQNLQAAGGPIFHNPDRDPANDVALVTDAGNATAVQMMS